MFSSLNDKTKLEDYWVDISVGEPAIGKRVLAYIDPRIADGYRSRYEVLYLLAHEGENHVWEDSSGKSYHPEFVVAWMPISPPKEYKTKSWRDNSDI